MGSALTGTGGIASSQFGSSVALSQDGVTALVGGNNDNGGKGAAWAFTLGLERLHPAGEADRRRRGRQQRVRSSVALSSDGNTALIGGPSDGINAQLGQGAAWVFTRSQTLWSQLGSKLTGSDAGMSSGFGSGVALSSDGNVALIGGQGDGGGTGAAWVFAWSGSTWAQQGAKLTGQGENLVGRFGHSVALAADGQTALIGGNNDSGGAGAAWAFAPPAPSCSAVSATAPAGGGAVSLTLPCSGPAGAGLSYAIVSAPAHGSLGAVGADGRVTVHLTPGYVGADTFSYRVSDTWGVSNTGIATITVPAFAAPVCSNVSAHGRKGATRVTVALSCQAPAGVGISYAIVTAPGDGKLGKVNQSAGRVTYIAPVGFSGTDRFIYRATDVGGRVGHGHGHDRPAQARPDHLDDEMGGLPCRTDVDGGAGDARQEPARRRAGQALLHQGLSDQAADLALAKQRVCKGKGKKRHCRLATPKERQPRPVAVRRSQARQGGLADQVTMIQPGSLGKEYVFRIVKSNQPSVKIQTLAPGSTAPCPGC